MFMYWGGPSWGKGSLERIAWINNYTSCFFQENATAFTSTVSHESSHNKYDICSLDLVIPHNPEMKSSLSYFKKGIDFNNYDGINQEPFPQISEDHLINYRMGDGDIQKSPIIIKNKAEAFCIKDIFYRKMINWISWKEIFDNNNIDLTIVSSKLHHFLNNKSLDDLKFLLSKTQTNLVPYREYDYSDQNIEQFIHKLHMFDSNLYGYKSIFQIWKRSKEKIFKYLDYYISYMRNVEKFLIDNNIQYQYYNLDDPNQFDIFGFKNYVEYDFHHNTYDLSNPIINEKYNMAKEMVIEWFESRQLKDSRLMYAKEDNIK